MTYNLNSYRYWYFGILLTCLVSTGLLCDFNFFIELDIQIHDTHVSIATWKLTALFFIATAFFVFSIMSIRSKFQNLAGLWVLLIHNSLIIGIVLYTLYVICAIMTADAFVELFRTVKTEQLMVEHLNKVIVVFLFIMIPLLLAEFFLIRRIKNLNKNNIGG